MNIYIVCIINKIIINQAIYFRLNIKIKDQK